MGIADDRWFAGFVDGEGYFGIHRTVARGVSFAKPSFKLTLRADDLSILEELQIAFGGTLHYAPARYAEACPQWEWHVAAKESLQHLVSYFDRFPLRAKKARDYAIWRRAVAVYVKQGRQAAELPVLAAELTHARQFVITPETETPAEPDSIRAGTSVASGHSLTEGGHDGRGHTNGAG